jgi:hypothetical protein
MKWALAGQICQIIAIYHYINIVQGVFMYSLFTLHRQRTQLYWELARLPALALVWIAVRSLHLGPLSAVAAHYGVLFVFSMIFLWLVLKALRKSSAP